MQLYECVTYVYKSMTFTKQLSKIWNINLKRDVFVFAFIDSSISKSNEFVHAFFELKLAFTFTKT